MEYMRTYVLFLVWACVFLPASPFQQLVSPSPCFNYYVHKHQLPHSSHASLITDTQTKPRISAIIRNHGKVLSATRKPSLSEVQETEEANVTHTTEQSSNIFDFRSLPFPQLLTLGAILVATLSLAGVVNAAGMTFSLPLDTQNLFDPAKFQPVCPASDGFYQFTKSIANSIIGQENVVEYGPLVASVLLRVRLELCVFESFVYEAVLPFIHQKGLSWILPLHETLETFIAGTIFAVASNFILLGSTKIFTVILIYIDALLGFPIRILGNVIQRFSTQPKSGTNKELSKPTVVYLVGKAFSLMGEVVGGSRKAMEVLDTFVGRYLVFATTVYILFKLAHYKFFNDLF